MKYEQRGDLKFVVAVSVKYMAWFDEDKRFAVGYSDGMVYLCSKDDFQEPVAIEAHQVGSYFVTE